MRKAVQEMIRQCIESFGRLDVLINNAGILRDKLLINTSEDDWDTVIRVHLKGTFLPMHHAGNYWRSESKAGRTVDGRVVNTTSHSGLFGNVGQANYAAAKMGIAGLTIVAAREFQRLGVTVNAVAPRANTRLTEGLAQWTPEQIERRDPVWTRALVTWLASPRIKGHQRPRIRVLGLRLHGRRGLAARRIRGGLQGSDHAAARSSVTSSSGRARTPVSIGIRGWIPEPGMLDRSIIGREFPTLTVTVGTRCSAALRRAIGETNAVFFDEATARAEGYRSFPIPPTYVFCLKHAVSSPDGVLRSLGVEGESGKLLHAEQSFEYVTPICAGDRISFRERVADVFEKKDGALAVHHPRDHRQQCRRTSGGGDPAYGSGQKGRMTVATETIE